MYLARGKEGRGARCNTVHEPVEVRGAVTLVAAWSRREGVWVCMGAEARSMSHMGHGRLAEGKGHGSRCVNMWR